MSASFRPGRGGSLIADVNERLVVRVVLPDPDAETAVPVRVENHGDVSLALTPRDAGTLARSLDEAVRRFGAERVALRRRMEKARGRR